jgi:hypothetical protein
MVRAGLAAPPASPTTLSPGAEPWQTRSYTRAFKPGFYMIVGPNWKGAVPAGIAGVVRSSTNYATAMPRIFLNDTPEDRAAILPKLNQTLFYVLSEFDGKMKTKDWSKVPSFPVPQTTTKPEYSTTAPPWVDPATFFDELPLVMKQVPPMPGEEALYKWIGSVLDAAEECLLLHERRTFR